MKIKAMQTHALIVAKILVNNYNIPYVLCVVAINNINKFQTIKHVGLLQPNSLYEYLLFRCL